jgi:cbb3-type cytochrome oxidase maturation protein
MSEGIVILMIGISTFLGAIGLLALIWAVRTGQFDDESKFIDAARFDNEEDLKDAVMMEEKKKKARKKREEKAYKPAD